MTASSRRGASPSPLSWKSDRFRVQGWLLLPRDYDPARKYPLIVEVHGGPAAAVLSRWGARGALSPAAFSALGYFVLQPNPRGSYGQGEAFTQANRKDFGYGDLRDILAGVDTVEAQYPIDPDRVGITGWSYGGFMTMFAVTQTHRFKAAVAGAGISDWQSYYGENSIDQWMIPYFGAIGLRRSRRSTPKVRPSTSSSRPKRPLWWWWATATANARRRSRSSSGTPCAMSTCRLNSLCTPMKATALSIPRTQRTSSIAPSIGSRNTCRKSREPAPRVLKSRQQELSRVQEGSAVRQSFQRLWFELDAKPA